jgi:hypothetical protein
LMYISPMTRGVISRLIVCAVIFGGAEDKAAPAPVLPVAHSALLTVEATPLGNDVLALHIRRVRDQTVVVSDDVKVTADGKNEPVTRESDGTYQFAANDLRGGGAHEVEVVVGHDGIREILSGQITLPEATSAGGLLGGHKQVAWWILNIVVVLVAVMALSRRKA